ncbi:hypothetical protein H632_c4967p0, partial [Helicosporidium sp. ATCC 50920]
FVTWNLTGRNLTYDIPTLDLGRLTPLFNVTDGSSLNFERLRIANPAPRSDMPLSTEWDVREVSIFPSALFNPGSAVGFSDAIQTTWHNDCSQDARQQRVLADTLIYGFNATGIIPRSNMSYITGLHELDIRMLPMAGAPDIRNPTLKLLINNTWT